MRDGHVALMLLSAFLAQLPYEQTIDGSQRVVDLHAEVGIESGVEIYKHIDHRHDDAGDP